MAIWSLLLLWNDLQHTAIISKNDKTAVQAANVNSFPNRIKNDSLPQQNQSFIRTQSRRFKFFNFYHFAFWISLDWTLPRWVKNLIVSVYSSKQQRLLVSVCHFGMSNTSIIYLDCCQGFCKTLPLPLFGLMNYVDLKHYQKHIASLNRLFLLGYFL